MDTPDSSLKAESLASLAHPSMSSIWGFPALRHALLIAFIRSRVASRRRVLSSSFTTRSTPPGAKWRGICADSLMSRRSRELPRARAGVVNASHVQAHRSGGESPRSGRAPGMINPGSAIPTGAPVSFPSSCAIRAQLTEQEGIGLPSDHRQSVLRGFLFTVDQTPRTHLSPLCLCQASRGQRATRLDLHHRVKWRGFDWGVVQSGSAR